MDIVLIIIGVILILYWVWLVALGSFAVIYDSTLDTLQKTSQIIICWVIPIIGATFILHLIWQHYPDVIPRSWVPWPFKGMVFGKPSKPNQNRDENEGPAIDGYRDIHHGSSHDFGGGDGD